MKKILLFLFLAGPIIGLSQNLTDSLIQAAEKTTVDTLKAQIYNEIANALKGRDNKQALYYAEKSLSYAEKSDFLKGVADVYKTIGIINFFKGESDSAFFYFDKSLKTFEAIGDKKGVAASYVNIGILRRNVGEIKESGDNYQKALEIYQEIGDDTGIAKTYLNLGNLFKQQGDMKTALDYYYKSLKFFDNIGDKHSSAQLYQNIGIVYGELDDSDKAIENFNNALNIFKETEDIKGIAEVNNNLGNNYLDGGEYELAIMYFEKSLKLFQEMGYTPMIANLYYNLGDANNKLKNYSKAKEYFDKSFEIYKTIGYAAGMAMCYNGFGEYYYNIGDYKKSSEFLEKAKELSLGADLRTLSDAVEWLSKSYAKTGKYKEAYENHVLYKKFNDSLFNDNTDKAITALSMQYEFDKKEKIREIEEKKKEALQAEQDKRDKLIKIALSAGILLMLLIAVILIRNYRRKVKANNLLRAQKEEIEHQKIELEQRNEEIQAQRDEIEDKNVLITEQRDIALKQKQEITDSIQYAQRIQEAVLPDKQMFINDISDYFILFKPKDIVSGDFYWMTKVDGKLIVVAADCTGHGVPGAFMSMLGVTFLNEIVNKDRVLQANEILNRLRNKVIDSLHQKDRETKDGMDIALAVINPSENELQFAGAYNSMYMIPSNSEPSEIKKIAADRMPIGIHLKMDKEFTNHVIKYNKGDVVFMFSDGYMDQFGGENGRKLKSKRFQELLLTIHEKPMKEQKKILDDFLTKWKGELEQLDDILVIGLKL